MTIRTRLSLLFVLYVFGITVAHAAVLSVQQNPAPSSGVVSVTIYADSAGESINAIEGALSYSKDLLTLDSISTTNSVIDLWVEQPKEDGGRLTWAGLIPGGFTGVRSAFYEGERPGSVFKAVFRVIHPGTATFSFSRAAVALNDGKGTAATLSTVPISFYVEPPSSALGTQTKSKSKDPLVIPDDAITINRSPLVQNNKWYVFLAADGNTISVQKYEVAESHAENPADVSSIFWHTITGPYILTDQSRESYVHVRVTAQDGRVGYKTIAPLTPYAPHTSFVGTIILFVLFGLAALLYVIFFRKRNL